MNQVKEIANTFGVDWPHLIAQVISFSIVCVLLYFFAYKRVLAMLEERRQRIAEGLANAEKIKAELARAEAQRGGQHASGHSCGRNIISPKNNRQDNQRHDGADDEEKAVA